MHSFFIDVFSTAESHCGFRSEHQSDSFFHVCCTFFFKNSQFQVKAESVRASVCVRVMVRLNMNGRQYTGLIRIEIKTQNAIILLLSKMTCLSAQEKKLLLELEMLLEVSLN